MVYDLREWQPNTLDSAMLELRARVINNELPVFDFPSDTAFEGFTHIFCGDVFDPNSPDDSVECWLADVEGDINYLTNISDLNPAFRTRICPEILVPEGALDWHGETLTLTFAAVDRNIDIEPPLTEVLIRLEIVPDSPSLFTCCPRPILLYSTLSLRYLPGKAHRTLMSVMVSLTISSIRSKIRHLPPLTLFLGLSIRATRLKAMIF